MLPERFLCLVVDAAGLGPPLRFLAHIEKLRRIPISLLPWSGRGGSMVDETGVRKALDKTVLDLIRELELPVTWASGDGDNWGEVAAELRPGDWLVLTIPRREAPEWEPEVEKILRRCPVPVLIVPDVLNPEGRGLLTLFDESPASQKALPMAAAIAEDMDIRLNLLCATPEEDAEDVAELVGEMLEEWKVDWQLSLVRGGRAEHLGDYANRYGPALCVVGVPGGGVGLESQVFGAPPLDPVIRELIDTDTAPLLLVPEWGTQVPGHRRAGTDPPMLEPPIDRGPFERA